MHQSPYAAGPAGSNDVSRALHVDSLELGGITEVLDLRGCMEGELAVLDVELVKVAHHRFGAQLAHPLGRAVRARERAHLPPRAPKPLDQRAADEPRSAGDERAGHVSARRAARSRTRRPP